MRIAGTKDTEIAVDPEGSIRDRMITVYRSHGLAVHDTFFSSSRIAEMASEADRLHESVCRGELDPRAIAYRPTLDGGKIFARIDPVCDVSEVFTRVARDPRLLVLVREVLGSEPFLFKDKLIYKFRSDAGYRLHQDWPYYGLQEDLADAMMVVGIPIDPITLENGGFRFFLGCHETIYPPAKGETWEAGADLGALADATTVNITPVPRSVFLFHPLAPHDTGPNRTPHSRRVLYLTYIRNSYADLRGEYYQRRFERTPIDSA